MIDKGESYKKLKKSFVIFICPFDLFGKGRHIYTFRNYCGEDKEILLGDDTAKIFLNAESRMEDINGDLRAFLDYVAGRKSEDSFVQKLEKAVDKAKQNRKWRHEYMTLLMRDQENFEKGIEQGIEKGIEQGIEWGKIYGAVSVYKELGMTDYDISKKLQKKFGLSEKEAEEYI